MLRRLNGSHTRTHTFGCKHCLRVYAVFMRGHLEESCVSANVTESKGPYLKIIKPENAEPLASVPHCQEGLNDFS